MSLIKINDRLVISLLYELISLWGTTGGQEDAVVGHHGA